MFATCQPKAELLVAEVKLLVKLHINENNFRLAAEVYMLKINQTELLS